MNRVLIILIILFSISCKKNEVNETDKSNFNKSLLNGIWTERENENAIFEIKNETLKYIEFYDINYLVSLEENIFTIRYSDNKILSQNRLLKLTKDSLVLENEDKTILKLFKIIDNKTSNFQ